MQNTLTPAERLIVAADFRPTAPYGKDWMKAQVLGLADSLQGTGICLKINSVLRACGYDLIGEIQSFGLGVFADLKLNDIPETMTTDEFLLREASPEFLTVMCNVGVSGLKALNAELPDTEVLGVTVLTSLKEVDTERMFCATVEGSVKKFALLAETAGLDGLICAPTDIAFIRSVVKRSMTFNTPAIRPMWATVPGDDQNPDRIMTPAKAIKAGAHRIIVGRPILQAKNPYDAVMRTIDEIVSAVAQ